MANTSNKKADQQKPTAQAEANGIERFTAFKKHDFLVSKRNALALDRIVVDNRFFSQFSQELMQDTINAEVIAQKLASPETYSACVTTLTNRTSDKVMSAIYPIPLVTLDVPVIESRKLIDACYAATSNMETALILAEFMRHCLAPYGLMHPVDDRSIIVSSHTTMLPTEKDILVDILKREIESLIKTIGTPYRGSEKKMGLSIVSSIISNVISDVGRALLYVGEYESIVSDVFRLIRANIDFTTDYKGIPRDLIRHPHVSAMARNVTLARIACGPKYATTNVTLSTATYELRDRITQIYNFITSSQRYSDISLSDFASRFSKSSISDSKGKKKAMILSMNLVGAPCAQVVHYTKDSVGLLDAGKFMELPEASAQVTAAYGSVLNHCSTYNSASLLETVMANYLQLSNFEEPKYATIGLVNATEGLDVDVIGHALALAKCDPARPAFVSLDDNAGLQFAYEVSLEGSDYKPVSGSRVLNGALLTDPFEFLLLSTDWRGDKALTDRLQLLPKVCLDKHHIVLDPNTVDRLTFNRRHRINIVINNDNFSALLSPSMVFGVRDLEAETITPVLNRAVVAEHLFVVIDALRIASTISNETQRVAVKACIFDHVLDIAKVIEPTVMGRVTEQITMQIIASAGESSYATEGKLSLRMYKKMIELHAADFVMRRFGVYEDAGDSDSYTSALKSIVSDTDFGTHLGVTVSKV